MAQSYTGTDGTLIIPMATADWKVQAANSGLSTTGVLMLVGEADAGPRFSQETSLQDNAFGSDQLASVIAKYGSGPLVDAYAAASAPANDPNIVGAPARLILVKTNLGTRAASALTIWGSTPYNSPDALAISLADKNYGKAGNLVYYTISAPATEVIPTTGAFTWIPSVGAIDVELRVNGGAALPATLGANATPASVVSTLDGLSGVSATGGALKATAQNSVGTLTLTAPGGNVVQVTYSGTWTVTPSAGDTLYIPTGSVIDSGAGDDNVGGYVITAADSNTITATKLSDGGQGGAVAGTVTAPTPVGPAAVSATATDDLAVYAPVVVTLEAANPVQGAGKTLEIAQLTSGADLLERAAFGLSIAPVTWVSKTGTPVVLASATESRVSLNVNRQKDNIQEQLAAGGEIALRLGYSGTTATVTITDTDLVTTVAGGSGASQSLPLKDFPTIQDVATFLNSKTGYTCAVGTAQLGQLPSTALDNVSGLGICTKWGEKTGRVKVDAFRFARKVNEESVLVRLQDSDDLVAEAASGLPQPVVATTYLAGGTKGVTLDADVTAALLALEKVRGNFLVPLFSRDASLDVAAGLTESGSMYTIEAINAGCRSHVLKMSALKRRRNRQAFLSVKDTFAVAKETSANLASFRCAVPFQDCRNLGSDGSVGQFAPWMNAAVAAGMQAAAFYRAIVRKFANIGGALQAAGDFDDQDDTQVEEALLAGLLPLRRAETGGWYWVSDQTSYGKDNNFVLNSIQAVYVADVIALTTAQRMENAFLGQSTADISAPLALAFLETIMADFLRLKLIARSDDALRGFRNAKVTISGTAMIVSLEVKLAGAIYFIPISFLVSQVQQAA